MANNSTPAQITPRKKVVIVGGGFAGLNAAKYFGKNSDLDVTLIDRQNYHLFQPLLYQVAMAGLNPGEIATPIRAIFTKYQNVRPLLAEAQSVDLSNKRLGTEIGTFPYDYLILACGAQHSYFGHEEWEKFAPGLKTLEQATEVRRRVLLAFELAERETDLERIRQLLTFVIVGGGPTGVELAGTLAEIARHTLEREFRKINPTHARIILIEAGSKILPTFADDLSKKATLDLENMGGTVWTSTRVTKIDSSGVTLDGEKLKSSTVLWAAGVKPSPLNSLLNSELDRSGRVIVKSDLSLPKHPDVFVLGDQAAFIQDDKPLPGLAPVAMQEGRFVAELILREIEGHTRNEFHYRDKGQMATIGRRRAVAQTTSFHLHGVLAWYVWLFVHVYYLIGFRSKLFVLMQWFWSYLTYRRGARLIENKEWRSYKEQPV